MRIWCVPVVVVGLVACGTSEASPTTEPATTPAPTSTDSVATAPPTTAAPTTAAPTTAPPATAAPTTVPATTVAPMEVAKQEMLATLAAFNADFDRCFGDVRQCDLAALFDTYLAPEEDVIRTFMTNAWNAYDADGTISISEGRVERSVPLAEVGDDAATGRTLLCETNDAYDIPRPEDTVVPPTVPAADPVFAEFYFVWLKQPDGRWVIFNSEWTFGYEQGQMTEGGINGLSPEQLAVCFE